MERNRKKKRYRINWIRMGIFILAVFLIVMVAMSVKSVVTLHQEQVRLKAENAKLTKEKAKLQEEFKNVNDRNYIEEQARLQLRLIRPGEILYILDEDGDGKDDRAKSRTSSN